MNRCNHAVVGLGLAAAGLLPALSFAAVDVTAVTAEITAAAAPVGAIGAGVLVLMVAIKVYKWVRSAM